MSDSEPAWAVDGLIVRWMIGDIFDEIRILRNNLSVISTFIQQHFVGMSLGAFNTLCNSMETIVNQLEMRYVRIFRFLEEIQAEHLWPYLNIFE